ncbi:stress protein [Herbaspirillum sp. LeCh32-8]|uniref:KGG domain-containing protein n=1 Tax=Herbaspirillum sp. LeCh32-8 TaxID=2821356 RepID=UPI001AEB77AD|nr:KGG domain-containing protein [Herbaspirillum sp. LeCh32-8]MBP0597219.1 stress protein [Herbaspirillum sp. LeCh32-8]
MANAQNPGSSNRGFAAMDPQKQRQIASMGGKAAHAKGAAHEFTSAEAREAGRKGGLNSHGRKNANAGGNATGSVAVAAPQMTQSAPQPQQVQQSQPSQQPQQQPQQSDSHPLQQG